ncbi:hypothetical protein [Sporosarcina sp. Marseille-Q4943]|uniref:hypothetical protein n=1 Tax=Sporosarcina sp. Marseille-Q4943 TaxID=2942204 RepID=UPI00208DD21E|nr:hypothetical protein [Sporosarcina sp. Marseille-Q4943]
MTKFDVSEAVKAQKEYQERTGSPSFPPTFGTCWSCNTNIYELYFWNYEHGRKVPANEKDFKVKTGISVEEAGERLVTGCPHCNRSYCD